MWNARVSPGMELSLRQGEKKKKNSTRWGGWNVLSNVCPPPVPYSNPRCREAPCVMRSPMPLFVRSFRFHLPPPHFVISILQWLVHFCVDLYVPRKWAERNFISFAAALVLLLPAGDYRLPNSIIIYQQPSTSKGSFQSFFVIHIKVVCSAVESKFM